MNKKAIIGIRWIARLLSLFLIGLIFVVIIGKGPPIISELSTGDKWLCLFFPVLAPVGLILAWRWEGIGGALTLVSMVAFWIIRRIVFLDWVFAGFLIAGVLFLLIFFGGKFLKTS